MAGFRKGFGCADGTMNVRHFFLELKTRVMHIGLGPQRLSAGTGGSFRLFGARVVA